LRLHILPVQRNELVLRILPGDRGHIGFLRRSELEQIGPPVGVDDEIGHELRPRGLGENVYFPRRSRAAFRIADDPAHGVAGGDRAGADELLAFLERDIRDLAGRGIDLVEGAFGKGINLHGIDVAVTGRLHACGFIGRGDPDRGIFRFRHRFSGRQGFQLAGQGQGRAERHDFDRPRRIGVENGGRRIAIIVDRRRLEGRTGGERSGGDKKRRQNVKAH
jgi:hypothetical protein